MDLWKVDNPDYVQDIFSGCSLALTRASGIKSTPFKFISSQSEHLAPWKLCVGLFLVNVVCDAGPVNIWQDLH